MGVPLIERVYHLSFFESDSFIVSLAVNRIA